MATLALMVAAAIYYQRQVSDRPTIVTSAMNGDLLGVQRFLTAGVSIDFQDRLRFGWTPLMAAIHGDEEGVAAYLIEHGADVNRTTGVGITALDIAIRGGATNIVERLLAAGADPLLPGGSDAYSAAQVCGQKEAMLAILNRYRKKKPED